MTTTAERTLLGRRQSCRWALTSLAGAPKRSPATRSVVTNHENAHTILSISNKSSSGIARDCVCDVGGIIYVVQNLFHMSSYKKYRHHIHLTSVSKTSGFHMLCRRAR